jgi:hypothetical protein
MTVEFIGMSHHQHASEISERLIAQRAATQVAA